MNDHDPRIDAYIAKSAPFAQPLLKRLRAVVHEGCPQVQESIKWGMPAFLHAGGILCMMAAFKQHATFGFWKHAQVVGEGADGVATRPEGRPEGMGSFGKLRSPSDLPPKKFLVALVRKAAALNESGAGVAGVRKSAVPRPPPAVPAELAAALARNKAAAAAFKAFPPSQQREYTDWIGDAKRADTRERRLAQAIEWLAEGKPRNWKYL